MESKRGAERSDGRKAEGENRRKTDRVNDRALAQRSVSGLKLHSR